MRDFGPYSVLYMIILLQKPWRDRGVGKGKKNGEDVEISREFGWFSQCVISFSFPLSLILHFISIPEEQ